MGFILNYFVFMVDWMNIEKEREAFEEWYCKHHTGLKQSDLYKFRTLSGYSFGDSLKIDVSWEAWQAAKAQAQADTKRIDFLADKSQSVANVMLPTKIVERNLSSLRDAIDQAMMIDGMS